MKKNLLSLLSCPECSNGTTLTLEASDTPEIIEGTLLCPSGHRFPIRRGIPRFVLHDNYAKNFSFEWTIHKKTQLDNATSRESEENFRNITGWTPDFLKNRTVLDAGCGMGRYQDVAQRWGAEVVGVDLSFAIDSAQENLGARERAHFVQADLRKLPFQPETFDVIYSIGVLHHTPDCKAAFFSLLPYLKKGGEIVIWVYYTHKFAQGNMWRKLTTHLPQHLLYALCFVSVPLYFVKKIPLLGMILQLLFPTSLHPHWRWRWLDTFDWYSPTFQSKHTYTEVKGWFQAAGLLHIETFEPPVAVRGRKP